MACAQALFVGSQHVQHDEQTRHLRSLLLSGSPSFMHPTLLPFKPAGSIARDIWPGLASRVDTTIAQACRRFEQIDFCLCRAGGLSHCAGLDGGSGAACRRA